MLKSECEFPTGSYFHWKSKISQKKDNKVLRISNDGKDLRISAILKLNNYRSMPNNASNDISKDTPKDTSIDTTRYSFRDTYFSLTESGTLRSSHGCVGESGSIQFMAFPVSEAPDDSVRFT